VQTVGELDEQDTDVAGNGNQQLAEVLGLLGFLGDEIELLDFGEPIDEGADLLAELLVDLGAGASVSSMTSCSSAAAMVASSSRSSVRMAATSRGWEK
jgi:hypothetical protein